MSISLPEAIATYFEVSNGMDPAGLARCFTPDAIVTDERHTYCGHEAIEAWKREARRKFEYSVEPLSVRQDGDRVTVTANVVGNFPGSPVQLDHVFLLARNKIQSLEIQLSERQV